MKAVAFALCWTTTFAFFFLLQGTASATCSDEYIRIQPQQQVATCPGNKKGYCINVLESTGVLHLFGNLADEVFIRKGMETIRCFANKRILGCMLANGRTGPQVDRNVQCNQCEGYTMNTRDCQCLNGIYQNGTKQSFSVGRYCLLSRPFLMVFQSHSR